MQEASKTRAVRGQEFSDKYFSGTVIDIGCGDDLVVPHAQPFDLIHGDANYISSYVPVSSFDCVHSSHCLEHMKDVPEAVRQWWSLVKPGGVMIIVVPEEELYEQGIWPPIFNPDHKATFKLKTSSKWLPTSYGVQELIESLPDAEILEIAIHDQGYDRTLKVNGMNAMGRAARLVGRARRKAQRALSLSSRGFDKFCERIEWRLGSPIDQTLGNALAQIQVVARKRKSI
jgi:SAM-dependent methyltransferase